MYSAEFLTEMNHAYGCLKTKMTEIASAVFHRIFNIECGWHSGQHRKLENGNWYLPQFPIPVIRINGFCNIEIWFDKIIIIAKRKQSAITNYSFEKFLDYKFEAYDTEDYNNVFYSPNSSVKQMKEDIIHSKGKEVEFYFSFPFDIDGKQIFEFAKLLRRENFYI